MKKSIAVLVLILLMGQAMAQTPKVKFKDQKTSIDLGFLLIPSGILYLKDPKKGLVPTIELFAIGSFTKGKWNLCPFYSTANMAGLYPTYQATDDIGIYGMISKETTGPADYASLGLQFTLVKDNAYAFIEFGSAMSSYTPMISVGMFVQAVRKVR